MTNSLECFKAYDIRGRVPEELSPELARLVGRAFVAEIDPGTVVVGRDMRLESPEISAALIQGLTDYGADVLDLGPCGTEEVYFQTFDRGVGGGIMVTASHNPKGFNGMKLVREGARPISGDTGLHEIKARVRAMLGGSPEQRTRKSGSVDPAPEKRNYIDHLLGLVENDVLRSLRIVADPGNGMAGPIIWELAERLPFEFVMLHDQPNGHFPNGVPNPLLIENRAATARGVVENQADFGIAWDGDFDRCFLYDETGRFIEGYYLVGLLAELLLTRNPGAK
ncbi:MAG TPA: phosphomannomutase CpsG, partial [Tichowtungia sp.]|nr:phosphomannomutase CpsG [Tichowtungia sp.]